jgi:hypothetical protein
MIVDEAYKNIEKIICYGFLYEKILFKEYEIPELINFYNKLPSPITNILIKIITNLNNVYSESLKYLEGFCYSSKSRYLWSIMDIYNRSSYVGIKGIDELGLNNVIENWIYINKKIDEEEEYNKLLNLVILIVGSNNNKAAKAITRNYENHQKEIKELREEICKYGYNQKREIENERKREEWVAPLLTREDLVKELYRQASGYKDKHDLFIEEWLKKQREKKEQLEKEKKQKVSINKAKIDEDKMEFSRAANEEDLKKIGLNIKKISKRIIR